MDYRLYLKASVVIMVFLSALPLSEALNIGIGVIEIIDGNIIDLRILSGPPQRYSILWSNTGSANCISKLRLEAYNEQNQKVFTGWSNSSILAPGQEAEFLIYSNLPQGRYTMNMRIYHCNEIFDQNHINFSVAKEISPSDSIEIVEYAVREGYIDVSIRSDSELENVAVIPEGFPGGWIFSQGFIESISPGETGVASLAFEPSLFTDRKITLTVLTEDGAFLSEKEIVIRKPENRQDNYQTILGIIIISAVIIISFLYHTVIKKLWKRQ